MSRYTNPEVEKLIIAREAPSTDEVATVAKLIGITDGSVFWDLFDYIRNERAERYIAK